MTDAAPRPLTIAMTGATGFVGRAVLDLALSQGIAVRALTRRPQDPRAGVTWVAGSLETPEALIDLATGADAVLHIAGVVNVPDRDAFYAGNAGGTAAMLAATTAAGVRRFVQVSSLAAREPDLSDYGWSKAQAEEVVRSSGLDWTIIRPPAVFGPGDTEMFDLFRAATKGVVPVSRGRVSVIFVRDLAALLLTTARDEGVAVGATWEPDDGRPRGWTNASLARAIGRAVGRGSVVAPAVPSSLLHLAARADRWWRGDAAKLTPDRARYIAHPDWVARADMHPPAALWHAATPTERALADTVAWYRREGWLAKP